MTDAVFKVVIPARYASTRLPGKPLRILAGRTMLEHVHRLAIESGAEQVVIATDDERIRAAADRFGADVCMTSASHPTGTDRLAEVVEKREWDPMAVVVNVQGDEPLLPPALVSGVAEDLAHHAEASIATLATPLSRLDDVFDPHQVKVVCDAHGYALYFSRAPVPWVRDAFQQRDRTQLPTGVEFLRHIGLYAYRAAFLTHYSKLSPSPIEQAEALEQLRALWHGAQIHVTRTLHAPEPGVDTAEDLARVEATLAGRVS
jgi:3-deoxy-manno-octulosonate cytidylyltransferase (CMP-KDO synthetase)